MFFIEHSKEYQSNCNWVVNTIKHNKNQIFGLSMIYVLSVLANKLFIYFLLYYNIYCYLPSAKWKQKKLILHKQCTHEAVTRAMWRWVRMNSIMGLFASAKSGFYVCDNRREYWPWEFMNDLYELTNVYASSILVNLWG